MGFVYILSVGTTLSSLQRGNVVFTFPSGLAISPFASKSKLALSPPQWIRIHGDHSAKERYSQCKADHWLRLVATEQWNACWANGSELGKHYLMKKGKQNTTSSWKSDTDCSSTLVLWGTWCFLWGMNWSFNISRRILCKGATLSANHWKLIQSILQKMCVKLRIKSVPVCQGHFLILWGV